MYHQVIAQCTQSLKNLEICLDKAERYAATKNFDIGVLMSSRLAPDMEPFTYQVQSACDYVKGAAAWLSGQTPPRHEDNEQTIDELRARIRKTVAFAGSMKEAQYVPLLRIQGLLSSVSLWVLPPISPSLWILPVPSSLLALLLIGV